MYTALAQHLCDQLPRPECQLHEPHEQRDFTAAVMKADRLHFNTDASAPRMRPRII